MEEKKKFNVNIIVNMGVFLYNESVTGAVYTISFVTNFMNLR